MMALTERDRRAIGIGAAVLIVSLGGAFVGRPVLHQHRVARETLARELGLLSRERTLLAVAPHLPDSLSAVRTALSLEERRAIAVAAAGTAGIRLAERLRDAAHDQHVLITQLTETPGDSLDASLRTVRVTVRAESDMRGVLSFVRSVESESPRVRVRALQIERAGQGARAPNAPPSDDVLTITATFEAPVVMRSAGGAP